MDYTKKQLLISKIRNIESSVPKGKEILLTIDDYFGGNDEKNCIILANTLTGTSSKEFESFLREG